MRCEILLVQHAEKTSAPGDPGLSERGRRQARSLAARFLRDRARAVYSSPARRAQETAAAVAEGLDLPIATDERLRERMNWGDGARGQTLEAFLREWKQATADREYVPTSGESSNAAGARAMSFCHEVARRHPGERVLAFTHGGVTLDLVRSVVGDEELARLAPGILDAGIPSCAVTTLVHDGALALVSVAETVF